MDKPSALHRRKHLSNRVKATPPFAGLSQELHWLKHCLQEASAGRPHVILISGQASIGRTRLLQELRSGALRRGLQVGYGRGYEDLALLYRPFVEVLHTLLDQLPRDLGHLVGNDAEVLRWLMHQDQASAHVTNPFTSTQSDEGRAVLIATGKFSSQKDELP
jgi:AAA ATPase domain